MISTFRFFYFLFSVFYLQRFRFSPFLICILTHDHYHSFLQGQTLGFYNLLRMRFPNFILSTFRFQISTFRFLLFSTLYFCTFVLFSPLIPLAIKEHTIGSRESVGLRYRPFMAVFLDNFLPWGLLVVFYLVQKGTSYLNSYSRSSSVTSTLQERKGVWNVNRLMTRLILSFFVPGGKDTERTLYEGPWMDQER